MKSDETTMYAFDAEGESQAAGIAKAATLAALARAAEKAPPAALPASDRPLLRKWKFLDALYADPVVSDRGKVMAHALLSRFDVDKGYARRGYTKLAEMVGKGGAKAAQRAVDDLVASGWFAKVNTRRGSKHEVNMYRPNFDHVLSVPVAERGEVSPDLSIPYGQDRPYPMDKNDHTLPPEVSNRFHEGNHRKEESIKKESVGQTATPFGNEDPEDPVAHISSADLPPKGSFERKPVKPSRAWIEPDTLDQWWHYFQDAYPHKPGLAKAKGMFCKVILERKATIDEVMDAVDRYVEEIATTGLAGANATRWLCDERWLDDYDSPPVNAAKAAKPSQALVSPRPAPKPASPPPAPVAVPLRDDCVMVDSNWRPSEMAWDLVLANEGEEATEEARVGFIRKHAGGRIAEPDVWWKHFCDHWFAPF